jgi:hypothetical protein
MSTRMEYQVALFNSEGTETYESTALFAADNFEAIEKAKRWTASIGSVAKDAWLQINLGGMGIKSLRPGEF